MATRVRRRAARRGRGKSDGPERGDDRSLTPPPVKEGDEAAEEIDRSRRRTSTRRQLDARHDQLEEVSPEVGELDEEAFDRAMDEDADAALALLADLTGATDATLRELARRLGAKLFLDLARRGPARPRGTGRIELRPYAPDRGDLDVDASLEAIVDARAAERAVDPAGLHVRTWTTPATAFCLLVDRSGSMGGGPLATAAVAAAAVAFRSPEQYAVLAFGRDVVAARSLGGSESAEAVVDRVLALRGHGTTDVAGALVAAREQLARSSAARKVTVLLSDCRATVPGDVVGAAAGLDELVIIAPEGDDECARELAAASGAEITTVAGPSDAAAAISRVLDQS